MASSVSSLVTAKPKLRGACPAAGGTRDALARKERASINSSMSASTSFFKGLCSCRFEGLHGVVACGAPCDPIAGEVL